MLTRHHLCVPAGTVEQAVDGVLALHATDPATITLSVLARGSHLTGADVQAALHERRSLVRMMAMRRTLFVVPLETAPVVHAGAALEVAARMWKRLATGLRAGSDPDLTGLDIPAWLADVAEETVTALRRRGTATGVELAKDIPRLRTLEVPTGTARWDVPRAITSQVLVALGTDGRIVRGEPQGGWTSRRHRWEPAENWWPDGIAPWDPAVARVELVRMWLARFGPATDADAAWWTGWTLGQTRKALAGLELTEVDLDGGETGLVLAGDERPEPAPVPGATLLPSLDPTPMGWKGRDFLFAVDRAPLFDRNGNIGPTVWWNGQAVGGWATRPDGEVVTELLTDIGTHGRAAVAAQAASLRQRLDGAAVTPGFPTPLAKRLSAVPSTAAGSSGA